MGRFTRFDHLETERAPTTQASPRPLERFVDDGPAPTAPPEPSTQAPLQRFATDLADEVQTQVDPLEALPTLECGACGTECGKFELACHLCGSRLDSDETRARNAARLTDFTADRQRAALQLAAKHEADVRARARAPLPPTRSVWVPLTWGLTAAALLASTISHLFLPFALAGAVASAALTWRARQP